MLTLNKKGYEIIKDIIKIYEIHIHETGTIDEFVAEIQIPVLVNIIQKIQVEDSFIIYYFTKK